jgi:hypothetical protein
MHPDIIHFHVNGDFIENRIFADITATNDYSQIGHLEWASKLRNFAFVRWTIDARYSSQSLNFNPDFDHLVMVDCTFRSCSVDFLNYNKRVLLRNLYSYKYRGNAAPDAFHQNTTIIENVHFTVDHSNSPSWATHGPVDWSAPSPPVGVSSNGSGDYISTIVQQPYQISNWRLGNRIQSGANGQQDHHHFYYEPAQLDLSPDQDIDEHYIAADLNQDGTVGRIDLAILLQSIGSWQNDITGDGLVDGRDLALLLGSWG